MHFLLLNKNNSFISVKFNSQSIYIADCGTPTAITGYVVGSYPATTYNSSSNMTCDTGYEGTAADITCTADGTWSTQTGCSIVSKYFQCPGVDMKQVGTTPFPN